MTTNEHPNSLTGQDIYFGLDDPSQTIYNRLRDLETILSYTQQLIQESHPDHLPFKLNDPEFWKSTIIDHPTDEAAVHITIDLPEELEDDDDAVEESQFMLFLLHWTTGVSYTPTDSQTGDDE